MLMPVKSSELQKSSCPAFSFAVHFPALPKSTVDRTLTKTFISATPCPHCTGTPLDQDEPIVTEQTDFSSLLFDNPVTFLAFLAEVIKQTILARDK